jgi:enamine deaminase RidA (YjgF/YER057c/UK114 family)
MSAENKAKALGIEFRPLEGPKPYLNMASRTGNLIFVSGHVSTLKGRLGQDVSIEAAYQAAREVGIKILQSVRREVSSLDQVRVIKLLGCVQCTPEFSDQHLVINGASDLYHEIFGKDGDGYHARSAVGFAALPTGVAVEVEAIFEIKP